MSAVRRQEAGLFSNVCTAASVLAAWATAAPRRASVFAAALVLAFVLACTPSSAFAEDDENVVNPQQRPDSSFIYDTSIAALGEADSYYDKQTVQVVGEVIGDSLRDGLRGQRRWITLAAVEKESTATISVSMTPEAAAKIDTFGKYGMTGTKLQVRGTFYLTCAEHEGLTDLHADVVSVVEKGKHHPDGFDANSFLPGVVAVIVGLAFMGVFYYLRERRR
ncbi:MAG: hydrolase [Gordonibacter sp.]|uniref:hydrolase n=1 Tax=Gordonibacter sp. TaxID=1968902 RepID=UPI002FCC8214